MSFRWLLSLIAAFALTAYLGVWVCSLLLRPPPAGEPLVVPPAEFQRNPIDVESASPSVITDLDGPVGFELSPLSVEPGGYLVLRAYGLAPGAPVSIENPFGEPPHLFEQDGHQSALLAVQYTVAPGEYLLHATGGSFDEEFLIRVLDKAFPEQQIQIKESLVSQTVDNANANEEYARLVQPLKFDAIDRPLWDGPFALPIAVAHEVTSEFGLLRVINNKPADRHGGIDLACARGTPVYAANDGRVLFAQQITLTGNTVMIEHGLGLKSWYYHMDSLTVSDGNTVKKGQQIGTVGTTGFSTGPHLHFATSVYNTYINPWMLLEAAPEV